MKVAEVLKDVAGELAGPLYIAASVVLVVGAIRLMTYAWHQWRFRKGVPLVFHQLTETDQDQVAEYLSADDLIPKLVAYIAEDPPGTLVPGGLGSSAATPVAERQDKEDDWLSALLSFAFARQPGYHVRVAVMNPDRTATPKSPLASAEILTITVTIYYQPGGRVIAAATINLPPDPDEIVSRIGAFCVCHVSNQRAVRNRTPRWEQWHSPEAYRLYREGLKYRQEAVVARGDTLNAAAEAMVAQQEEAHLREAAARASDPDRKRELREEADRKRDQATQARANERRYDAAFANMRDKAAERFAIASGPDPSNLLPKLAHAALLELKEYDSALELYKACRLLWPEQVEVAYRLAAHDPRHNPDLNLADATNVLSEMREQLQVPRILGRWMRTWMPGHWAPGERRYLWSWLRPDPPSTWAVLRSKRREYLTATRAVLVAAKLWKVTQHPLTASEEAVRELFIELDSVLNDGKGGRRMALRRLLHPEREVTVERGQETGATGTDPKSPPMMRLLHPEQTVAAAQVPGGRIRPAAPVVTEHLVEWHTVEADLTRQVNPPNSHPAHGIGWLAHFNAACAFSVAIDLPEQLRPWLCSDAHWKIDCCAAALRQLTKVLRHPYNQLDPSWLRYDPDLEPLRRVLFELSQGLPATTGKFTELQGAEAELARVRILLQLAIAIGLPVAAPATGSAGLTSR